MIDAVVKAIRQFNMIEEGEHVVVGVSGGADSTCLLLHLVEYCRQVPFKLSVVHINHLIREDAAEDAEFVRELCNRYNIPFYLHEIDVMAESKRRQLSVEEAGRQVRYEAFKALNPDKIAVGHHRDDTVETFLFNLCRGTGIHGLTGIAPVQDGVIRPFCNISREDIEKYLADINQEYRTDSTNLKTDYSRNKFRIDVIPYLNREVNSGASEHIADAAANIYKLEQYIEAQVDNLFKKAIESRISGKLTLKLAELKQLDEYILGEVILRCFDDLHQGRKDITRNHVNSVCELLHTQGEKRLNLPYNISVVKNYDYLIFDCHVNEEITLKEISLDVNGGECRFELNEGVVISARLIPYDKTKEIPDNKYTKWFDYDKINRIPMVRGRKEGDYLVINSDMQRKSLKEYMINEKIPKSERDSQLLLADGSHIIWVIGKRISHAVKVDEETKNILEVNITIQED